MDKMSMKLVLTPDLNQTQKLHIIPDYLGKLWEIIDFWFSQPKLEIELDLPWRKKDKIEFVFAPPSWLNYIDQGEKYGAYIGDMFFINANLAKKHTNWVPYILLKLWSERHVDQGLDESGKVKHIQALWETIRFAGTQMENKELYEFLGTLIQHERTGYFELDTELELFIAQGGGDPREAKRAYLEKHHFNRWVKAGRVEEELASAYGITTFSGYRNHAEAVISAMADLDLENLYLAAVFIHNLAAVDPDEQILISPPFNAIAYALTMECNNMTDLVEFRDFEREDMSQDMIIKLPHKRRTWRALSKRISYRIHKAEEQSRRLMESEREKLKELMQQTKQKNLIVSAEIKKTEALTTTSDFALAKEKLEQIGKGFKDEITELGELSVMTTENISVLAQVSSLLEERI